MKKDFKHNFFAYKESQFTRKDYQLLYKIATPGNGLNYKISEANFRDKRFQRSIDNFRVHDVFNCPIEDLARHISTTNSIAQDIIKWRLHLNK